MKHNFKINGLNNTDFNHLFEKDNNQLKSLGVIKMIADEKPGFPCRISLEDAELGEEVLLFTYEHHKTTSPYKSSGPIFIRKNAYNASLKENEIPHMLKHRLLSIRGYDQQGMMLETSTMHGEKLESVIDNILDNPAIEYIHIHNSGPGCFNCQVDRVN